MKKTIMMTATPGFRSARPDVGKLFLLVFLTHPAQVLSVFDRDLPPVQSLQGPGTQLFPESFIPFDGPFGKPCRLCHVRNVLGLAQRNLACALSILDNLCQLLSHGRLLFARQM